MDQVLDHSMLLRMFQKAKLHRLLHNQKLCLWLLVIYRISLHSICGSNAYNSRRDSAFKTKGLVKAPLGRYMLPEAVAQTSERMSIWSEISSSSGRSKRVTRSYPSIKDSWSGFDLGFLCFGMVEDKEYAWLLGSQKIISLAEAS